MSKNNSNSVSYSQIFKALAIKVKDDVQTGYEKAKPHVQHGTEVTRDKTAQGLNWLASKIASKK